MKAVSPVIATVIIVAVAIAVSIAVALWITGLVGGFTGVEKVEVVNAYPEGSEPNYNIKITVKNTGTKAVTIDQIFVNDKLLSTSNITSTIPITLSPGQQTDIQIKIGGKAGQTLSIVIHTASGGRYPTSVQLP